MRDIFVVAGNKREYMIMLANAQEQWDYEIKNKMVHYVDHPQQLVGITGARVFLCGTYFKRRDWEAIENEIAWNGHRKLLVR